MSWRRGIHYDPEAVYCSKEHRRIHLANKNDNYKNKERRRRGTPLGWELIEGEKLPGQAGRPFPAPNLHQSQISPS